MSQLHPLQLEDGITIYIEANEETITPVSQTTYRETTRSGRDIQQTTQQVIQNFSSLQNTIKAFAVYTLNSFKEISNANVDKVTLEFGINISGEAGIPYVTKGSVGSNLKITLECSLKKPEEN